MPMGMQDELEKQGWSVSRHHALDKLVQRVSRGYVYGFWRLPGLEYRYVCGRRASFRLTLSGRESKKKTQPSRVEMQPLGESKKEKKLKVFLKKKKIFLSFKKFTEKKSLRQNKFARHKQKERQVCSRSQRILGAQSSTGLCSASQRTCNKRYRLPFWIRLLRQCWMPNLNASCIWIPAKQRPLRFVCPPRTRRLYPTLYSFSFQIFWLQNRTHFLALSF